MKLKDITFSIREYDKDLDLIGCVNHVERVEGQCQAT